MIKDPIKPMSKENLASNIAGFPLIKSPLKIEWATRPFKIRLRKTKV